MMRYGLALLLSALLVPPAIAQDGTVAIVNKAEDARGEIIAAALGKLSSDPAAAIAALDPVIAEYDQLYAKSEPVFCASDITNTLTALVGAIGAKKNAVVIGPNRCFALWAKGFALAELKRYDEAIAPLARASAMMPERPQFAAELGYAHQALRHWDQSYDAYAIALERAQRLTDEADRNKELRRAYFGMAYSEIERGKLDEAEKLLQLALKAAPGDKKVIDELEYVRQEKAKKGKTS